MYKPNYSISSKVLADISKISEIKAIIERSRVLPLNEAQLRRQAIVRMAHTSTSIEGNKLAEFQVDKVLSGMSVIADQKSITEVKNYQSALEKIEEMSLPNQVLSIENILSLHEVLMKGLLPKEKTGHFRPGSVYVIDELGDGREKVRYEGPESSRVAHLVNELLKWLVEAEKDGLHPIILAGVFHVQFVTIHPFSDGNGRITRLLTTQVLYKAGWDFRKIIVLEDFYNRDRNSYYNALNSVQGQIYHEGEDLTSWLEYFTEGFLVEARKVLEAIQATGFDKVSEVEEQVFLNSDEIKMMDLLTTKGKITSSDIEGLLGIAKRTSQLKLKNLVGKGLIKLQGKGPATYYILSSQ